MDSELDLIIGIDVGASGTGVAFINLTKRSDLLGIRTMSRWPGKTSESKVPTLMAYDSANVDQGPTSWGFESKTEREQDSDRLLAEWFKSDFQARSRESSEDSSALPDVDTLYCDFLSKLYGHIRETFLPPQSFEKGLTWDTAAVEFVFSVPATWRQPDVDRFLAIARKAGFGSGSHRIATCLTEPHAVAIYAAHQEQKMLTVGENVLVIDAGASTVDFCLLEVNSVEKGHPKLEEKLPAGGDDVGSANIDDMFKQLATNKLEKLGHEQLGLRSAKKIPRISWRMRNSDDFQNVKVNLGATTTAEEHFHVKMMGASVLKPTPADDVYVTNTGEMVFRYGELMAFFDDQCQKIKYHMDDMIDDLQLQKLSNVEHVIFSGGLGGSTYIQESLRRQYGQGTALEKAKFHSLDLPQMCVCKGLVIDRFEKMKSGKSSFSKLCAPVSLGVLKRVKYNSLKSAHRLAKKEQRVKKLPNGQEYVPYVEWCIKKGKAYDPDKPIFKQSHMRFASTADESNLHGQMIIVQSKHSEPAKYTDWEEVHKVPFDFQGLDEENIHTKHGSWYNKWPGQKPYRQVDFVISAKLTPVGAIFDCLSSKQQGIKVSRDAPIQMEVEQTNPEAEDMMVFN
ncbi:hypothetical protein PG989_007806 [Apiospora arundinis]